MIFDPVHGLYRSSPSHCFMFLIFKCCIFGLGKFSAVFGLWKEGSSAIFGQLEDSLSWTFTHLESGFIYISYIRIRNFSDAFSSYPINMDLRKETLQSLRNFSGQGDDSNFSFCCSYRFLEVINETHEIRKILEAQSKTELHLGTSVRLTILTFTSVITMV